MAEKIALIVGTNLHWAPFYYRYQNILVDNGIDFDLILWNRENIVEITKATNVFECNTKDSPNNKNPLKVWKFFVFCSYVKGMIKHNNYDKLVFVGTYGCAISLCSNYLVKNYSNKMWIDIRDDLYEWFKPFYLTEKKSIDASYATVVSSHEFTTFLPEHDYYFMHNIDPNAQEMIEKFNHRSDPEGKIRISFIGNVRYYEQNKALLLLLGNDPRYKIQYYGCGSDVLKTFCVEKNIDNVDFYGRFLQEDTIKFYEKTDIINNIYGNETMNLRVALSNKLYYGLFLKLPILVSDGTYMERLTKKYEIGFTFKNDITFADDLYKWYMDLKKGAKKPKFDLLWDKVKQEDADSIAKLYQFLGIKG